jgi:zinc transport system substrate-binding protein
MRVVDTTEGIERMPMAAHRHLEGDGQLSAVEPERPDPHVWLSPALVKVQAHTVCETLAALDPGHREVYEENLERFVAEVDALDGEIRELLGGLEATKFLVFHPSWGYFARDYGLEMVPVEVGGQEPGAAELAAFIEEARVEDVRVIFAQPEFSTRAATVIAGEIDGQVLLASPLAPDWPDNLRRVAQTFAEVLAP